MQAVTVAWKPPRGAIVSVVKVFSLIVDYWLGYALKIGPAVRRSQLIIFDRYIYYLLVDSKRIRYGGPAWLLKMAAHVVPRPDLVILLDAPANVLWSRKQEVPLKKSCVSAIAIARSLASCHSRPRLTLRSRSPMSYAT